jgi:predicted house-cleaning NTP pyrophosphatase (Maf/HAM1 superfamily)
MAEHVTQVSNVRFRQADAASRSALTARRPNRTTRPARYGIQGLAALFVEHIEGSHSGIMGLPLFETAACCAGPASDDLTYCGPGGCSANGPPYEHLLKPR